MNKEVGEAYVARVKNFELTCCPNCFAEINDANGTPLEPPHECGKMIDVLCQEIATILKNHNISDEKDKRLWALHLTSNKLIDKHLQRRTRRKHKRAKPVEAQ